MTSFAKLPEMQKRLFYNAKEPLLPDEKYHRDNMKKPLLCMKTPVFRALNGFMYKTKLNFVLIQRKTLTMFYNGFSGLKKHNVKINYFAICGLKAKPLNPRSYRIWAFLPLSVK